MSRLNFRSGSRRSALAAVLAPMLGSGLVALVAAGPFSAAGAAEPWRPAKSLFRLDLTWTASLLPEPADSVVAPEPPPLLRFDDAPGRLLAQASPSSGLQFSLDPEGEEVFLGWQFEF